MKIYDRVIYFPVSTLENEIYYSKQALTNYGPLTVFVRYYYYYYYIVIII